MLLSMLNMEQCIVGIGCLDLEIVCDFSNVGLMVCVSGYVCDICVDYLFVSYGLLLMEVYSEQGCDVIFCLKVCINEVYILLNMIDFGLDNLLGGLLMVEGFIYILYCFVFGFVEVLCGDDIYWSMIGDNQKLYCWCCCVVIYVNWLMLCYMLCGNIVFDVLLIIGSFDFCYFCIDWMIVVDVCKKKSKVVLYKEFECYSIECKNLLLK